MNLGRDRMLVTMQTEEGVVDIHAVRHDETGAHGVDGIGV